MSRLRMAVALLFLPFASDASLTPAQSSASTAASHVFGYQDFSRQSEWDRVFIAVPDPKLAGQHLKTLTAEPHWASSPEDYKTAEYVAARVREAGLHTEIVPYRVLLNKPVKIEVEAFGPGNKELMRGPRPEHIEPTAFGSDLFQNDPRILPAFNSSSPSGDVTADVVYANYGTLADFKRLDELHVSERTKLFSCDMV